MNQFRRWVPDLDIKRAAVYLLLIGIVERVLLAIVYGPVEYGDTGSYLRLANALSESGLSGYDGTRVPGYPVMLAVFDGDLTAVWVAQLALGVLISLLVFWLVYALTGSANLGFAGGMAYNLLAGPMLFEFNLLSETLAMVLLLAAFSAFAWLRRTAGLGNSAPIGLLVGTTAALAGLTRTLFFTLPLWLLLLVITRSVRPWKERLAIGAALALPALVLLGGWIGFIYGSYHMISPTTMGGYHLVQHTGEFFEYVPDEYATIREIYLTHRNEQIVSRGSQANAIWDAIPELTRATGLSFFDLSRQLQEISLELIREYPHLYLRNVVEGWIWFWKAPVYWNAEAARPAVAGLFRLWTLAGRAVLLLANFLFLAGSLVAAGWRSIRQVVLDSDLVLALSGYVWLSSILQTLADHGDNPRFLIPLQMLVVASLIWAIGEWWTLRLARGSN